MSLQSAEKGLHCMETLIVDDGKAHLQILTHALQDISKPCNLNTLNSRILPLDWGMNHRSVDNNYVNRQGITLVRTLSDMFEIHSSDNQFSIEYCWIHK